MRALMALAFLASVAGCDQPEGTPTTNGEEILGDSQVAGGGAVVNASLDPGASAPETGANDGATDSEASASDDPGEPIAGEDVSPTDDDPCATTDTGPVYFTPELGYELFIDKRSVDGLCELTLTGPSVGKKVVTGTGFPYVNYGEMFDGYFECDKHENGKAVVVAIRVYIAGTNELFDEHIFILPPK